MKFYNNQPRVEKVIAIFQNILIFWRVLFNLYSEMLIKDALQDEDGIKINGESITTIRYADDTAILAEKEEGLQRANDG